MYVVGLSVMFNAVVKKKIGCAKGYVLQNNDRQIILSE